ncbi:VOC family protein [soil metagenome]
MTEHRPRFHLAFVVDDLAAARTFYGEVLGCREGRSSETWVDFDLYGHQIVAHLDPAGRRTAATNPVDGHDVPVPHFGVLLQPAPWHELAERLRAAATTFVVEPHTRFAGEPGEQYTMFMLDPAGNALEFKAFADDAQVFAT